MKCSSSSTCRMTATGKPSEAAIFASPWPLSNRHFRIRSRVEGNRSSDVICFLSATSEAIGLRGTDEVLPCFTMLINSFLKFDCSPVDCFIKPFGLNSATKPKRDRARLNRRIKGTRQFCRRAPMFFENLGYCLSLQRAMLVKGTKHLLNSQHYYRALWHRNSALSRKKCR